MFIAKLSSPISTNGVARSQRKAAQLLEAFDFFLTLVHFHIEGFNWRKNNA